MTTASTFMLGSSRSNKKTAVKSLEEQFLAHWSVIERAINEIHAKNASKLSFEEIYRSAYNAVLLKQGQKLYESVTEALTRHLEMRATKLASISTDKEADLEFLLALRQEWEDHKLCLMMVRDILLYMDRTHVPSSKVKSSYELGMSLFLGTVLRSQNHDIMKRLRSALIDMINSERNGAVIDHFLVRSLLVDMLVPLADNVQDSPYIADFEATFLDDTHDYYLKACETFLQNNDVPSYIRFVEERLQQEDERVNKYMHNSTLNKLAFKSKNVLIVMNLDAIMSEKNCGFIWMLQEMRLTDIHNLYVVVRKTDEGFQRLNDTISAYIRQFGTKINQDHTEGPKWVEKVLEFLRAVDTVWTNSLEKHRTVEMRTDDAFSSFINSNRNCAKYLCSYLDEHLNKKSKKSPEEIAEIAKESTKVLKFIVNKDVFEHAYKNSLASRILNDKMASEEVERQVLTLFKEECGNHFTLKMEGMFHDIQTSTEVSSEFKLNSSLSTGFSIMVLTTSKWPSTFFAPSSTFLVPSAFENMMKQFDLYYGKVHSGRKLTWALEQGSVDVVSHVHGDKRREINMNLFCASILLLFNDNDSLSYQQIEEKTGIVEEELHRCLLSLSCGKVRILNKAPQTKTLGKTDFFTVNEKLNVPQYRFKLPMIVMRRKDAKSDEMSPEIDERVEEERKDIIDANIVRIMKSRKNLGHNELITQITEHLSSRFMPDPSLIKKRIEVLIEREYLERDPADRKKYNYLA